MIGRIMADWPANRSLGLLLLLPLWNPVLAAEQIGTLAAMSDARFIVQTGIGGGKSQFDGMGVELRRRGSVTDEAIEVMKRLFAGEVVDNETFGITGAAINPRPPQPVEWWIGSGTGDAPLERAARDGDVWYVSPGITLADLAPAIERYRDRCSHYGTTPRVALRRDVFVADDDGAAVTTGEQIIAGGYRGMSPEVLVFGGVERVVDALAPFAAIGVDDIVARTATAGGVVTATEAVRSIDLLGAVREQLAAV